MPVAPACSELLVCTPFSPQQLQPTSSNPTALEENLTTMKGGDEGQPISRGQFCLEHPTAQQAGTHV